MKKGKMSQKEKRKLQRMLVTLVVAICFMGLAYISHNIPNSNEAKEVVGSYLNIEEIPDIAIGIA